MSRLSVPFNQGHTAQRVLEKISSHPPANLPVPNPTKSFWINSTPDANPLAAEGSDGTLTSDADICIIGSGITGMQRKYYFLFARDAQRLVLRRRFCVSLIAGYRGRQAW